MKAVTTAGGGVMFIPDELERKSAAISYADLQAEEKTAKKVKPFGKRTVQSKQAQRAAA
jgi:hypothetical protein